MVSSRTYGSVYENVQSHRMMAFTRPIFYLNYYKQYDSTGDEKTRVRWWQPRPREILVWNIRTEFQQPLQCNQLITIFLNINLCISMLNKIVALFKFYL